MRKMKQIQLVIQNINKITLRPIFSNKIFCWKGVIGSVKYNLDIKTWQNIYSKFHPHIITYTNRKSNNN